MLNLDGPTRVRVHSLVELADYLLSRCQHVRLLSDRPGIRPDRIEHLGVGRVLDLPESRRVQT